MLSCIDKYRGRGWKKEREREIWASESYLGLRFDTLVGHHSHVFLTAGCLSFLLKKKSLSDLNGNKTESASNSEL